MSRGTITKVGNTASGLGTIVTQPTLDLLTAMGHGNGSGATEEFVTMPGMSNTVNVANYDGATNAAKVNAAIADAVTKGKAYCFVPKSLQPYDTSLVTFDDGVLMIREGGSPNWLDVRAYGAAGDGTTDDYHSLQAAIDHAKTNTAGLRVVYFPVGTYATSIPIQAGVEGLQIIGTGQGYNTDATPDPDASCIKGTHAGGPVLLICAPNRTVAGLTTSLIGGTGQAMDFTGSDNLYFNLRDELTTCDLNGLAQFSVECFYQGTRALSDLVMSSQGKWLSHDTARSCFGFGNVSGKLWFRLTTTGGTGTLNTGAINDGLVHHIAGSYDGTTLRSFVDGTMVASTPLTGTLLQYFEEGVWLGRGFRDLVEANTDASAFGPRAVIDSPRLSSTARYTADFTPPTTQLTSDSSTLFLMTCDITHGPLVKVYTKNGVAWLPQREIIDSSFVHGIAIRGLAISDPYSGRLSGISLLGGVVYWSIQDTNITLARNGIHATRGNKFGWAMRRVTAKVGATGRFGVVLGTNAGIGHADSIWIWSGPIAWVSGTGGYVMTHVFLQMEITSKAATTFLSTQPSDHPVLMQGVNVNTESGAASDWRASILADGGQYQSGFLAESCAWETITDKPTVILDSTQSVTLHAVTTKQAGSPAAVIVCQGSPNPVSIDHSYRTNTAIPWTDIPGLANIVRLGKGSAVTYSATPTFDCSVRDEFEITLTGDCAPTITNVTPGQSILVTIIQDGAGAHGFTWPANVKGGGTVSATGGSVNQQRFTAMLDSATNPTLMADAAMVSV